DGVELIEAAATAARPDISDATTPNVTGAPARPGSIQDSFVSIVIPCLNEAGFIIEAIDSVTPRSRGAEALPFDYEILVLDGGSTDGTIDLVRQLARANPRIRLMNNPRRLQSAAVNLAADYADPRATVLLRADSHAVYPADFVATCL